MSQRLISHGHLEVDLNFDDKVLMATCDARYILFISYIYMKFIKVYEVQFQVCIASKY